MTTQHTTALAAATSALLAMLVLHASHNDSFGSPSTFVGIAVGIALATAAWLVIRRVRRNRD